MLAHHENKSIKLAENKTLQDEIDDLMTGARLSFDPDTRQALINQAIKKGERAREFREFSKKNDR
jgi:hypothetical protein